MPWENLLYLSVLGTALAVSAVAVTAGLGIRYRKELPKLPILRSIEALDIERENLEAQVADLQDRLATANDAIREGERQSAWLEEARPKLEELQQEIITLQEGKQTALAEFERESMKLEREREELNECREELEVLKSKLVPLRAELSDKERRIENARRELSNLDKLRAEHAELRGSLPALKGEHAGLKDEVKALRKDKNTLDQQIAPIRKEHAALSGEIEGLVKTRDTYKESIEELARTHASAGGVSDDHDHCEDLWVPYFPERVDSGEESDESSRLHEMQQQLEAAKIRLPQRALRAFHTALKVQDISPLTVLAGISGTGKSLLPRLYAKCMGVHFLNLPVQPGWNSPQDLFGFYNYIEHKFKATSLARALVQFDQFNRAQWPLPEDAPDLSDQVLLVLLDEMNLARVEYYFSELLSRLETRRTISDPTDPEERRKVEIPLEIGHGSSKLASLSLYPGENVLFAGTMNEDESTLSLSDKVLDRASVIRFGRPAEIIDRQPAMGKIESARPLSLENWKRWLVDQEIEGEIRDQLRQLGGVMAEAQAPFGHRVAQGIIRYVGLYPGQGLGAQRHALADQIEQKILPRLRGKDLRVVEGPMHRLSKIVNELEDEQLVRAIEAGIDDELGTFMWTGLDRIEE